MKFRAKVATVMIVGMCGCGGDDSSNTRSSNSPSTEDGAHDGGTSSSASSTGSSSPRAWETETYKPQTGEGALFDKLRSCQITGEDPDLIKNATPVDLCVIDCLAAESCDNLISIYCGDENSGDLIDYANCAHFCWPTETSKFQCGSGETKYRSFVCDSTEQCDDSSDESSSVCVHATNICLVPVPGGPPVMSTVGAKRCEHIADCNGSRQ